MTEKVIKRRQRVRNTDRDYVNGPTMHKAIQDWYIKGKGEPPAEVVLAIMQINQRLSTRYNFRNYTYVDEMILDGIMACTAAVVQKKYNPEKYDNPFGYFTRIAYNAFVARIKEEHKQVYIKHKELEDHMIEASARGETLEYERDDSGRLNKLVLQFEGEKNYGTEEDDSN